MDIANTGSRFDQYFQAMLLDPCKQLARRSELLFVVLLTFTSLVMSAAVDISLTSFGLHDPERPALLARGVVFLVLGGVVFAPLVETLLFQQLPIILTRRLGGSRLLQFLAGCVPFAAMHFDAGLINGFAGGVAGGFVLSLAYLALLPQSKAKAFAITAAIHSLHNLVPIAMIAWEMKA